MTHHHSNQLVQKLWNYCNVLRDGELSYGDYVEQLTFLLFLKMADEQSRPPHNRPSAVPKGFGCDILITLDGDDLETHYRHTLEELGKRPGMLGVIFRKAQNKIQDPALFARRALRAVERNRGIIIEPPWWRLFWYLDRLSPRLADKLAEGTLHRMRRELERLQG